MPNSPAEMLSWQYRKLIGELQQVQLHAEDPSCPCGLRDIGEFCLPKHSLNVETIAAETAAMDSTNSDLLYELQESAISTHDLLKSHVCGKGKDADIVAWARNWRKKIEPIYYACKAKLHDSADLEAKPKKEPGGPPVWCSGVESVAQQMDRLAKSLLRTKAQMSSVRGNLSTALNICAGQAQLLADAGPISVLDPHGSRCRDPQTGLWTKSKTCGFEPVGNRTIAFGADGMTRYEFEFRIIDLDTAVVSHDPFSFALNPAFPAELQPRMRTRKATQVQVEKIAAHLEPDNVLMDFHVLDRGTPIVGPDLVVEAGNGRVMAIKRAAKDHQERYAAYKRRLTERVRDYGLRAEDVKSVEQPLLVRVRLSNVDRVRFAQETNAMPTIATSAIENAKTDAERITLDMLQSLDIGENESLADALRAPKNQPFARRFLATLPDETQAALVDAQGYLNLDGVHRMAMAVFVSAFQGDAGLRLAEKAFEVVDDDIRSAVNAIGRSLGPLAQAEALVKRGQRDAGLSIADDLAQTLVVYSAIKNNPALTVEKYLAQGQLTVSRELTPFDEKILRTLHENRRSAKRLGEILRAYAQSVIDQPPPQQAGMFGGAPMTKEELWNMATTAPEAVLADEAELNFDIQKERERFLSAPFVVEGRHRKGAIVADYAGNTFQITTIGFRYHEAVSSLLYGAKSMRKPKEWAATVSLRQIISHVLTNGIHEVGSRGGEPDLQRNMPPSSLKAEWRDGKPNSYASFPRLAVYVGDYVRAVKPNYDDAPTMAWVQSKNLANKALDDMTVSPGPAYVPEARIKPRQLQAIKSEVTNEVKTSGSAAITGGEVRRETPPTAERSFAPSQVSMIGPWGSQARMFDSMTDIVADKLEPCNVEREELERVLSWKPLRDMIASWVGYGNSKSASLCSVGMTPGVYQLTFRGVKDPEKMHTWQKRLFPQAKRVHSATLGEMVYELVLPRQEEREFTWTPQEVGVGGAYRREKSEQAALFADYQRTPVVYHGGVVPFAQWDMKSNKPVFFSSEREIAEWFGTMVRNNKIARGEKGVKSFILEATLEMANPLVLTPKPYSSEKDESHWQRIEVRSPWAKKGSEPKEVWWYSPYEANLDGSYVWDWGQKLQKQEGIARGHDGVIIKRVSESGFTGDVYVVRSPTQIHPVAVTQAALFADYQPPNFAPLPLRSGEMGVIPPEYQSLKVDTKLVRAPGFDHTDLPLITTPPAAQKFFSLLRQADREWLLVILCNQQNRVIGMYEQAIGGPSSASVSMQVLARVVLLAHAQGVIIAHNHPSGATHLSFEDKATLERIKHTLEGIEVKVLDFFVVGDTADFSVTENRELPAPKPRELKPPAVEKEPVAVQKRATMRPIWPPRSPQAAMFAGKRPACTPEQAQKLERCIQHLKERNRQAAQPEEGTGRKGAPNPFAVCQKSVGCRKDEARIDKLAQALIADPGRFRESGYTVCQQGKKLVHGPHADGDHSSVTVSVACPAGAKPVAIYHTHPSGHLEPSDLDLKASQRFGVPVCIGQTDGPTVKCHQG